MNKVFESSRNISSLLFIFSIVVFFISMTPASFSAGYLAGAAGVESGGSQATDYGNIAQIGLISSAVSGFVAAVTGIATMILKMREERRLQLQYELEKKKFECDMAQAQLEIERTKLELEKQLQELKKSKAVKKS